MEEYYEKVLAKLPKEWLQYFVLRMMQDDKISFPELAEMHVMTLEKIKKGETQEVMNLRSKIIELWCGTKKDLPKKLTSFIQEGKDNGWVNITQEQINNSKWNK